MVKMRTNANPVSDTHQAFLLNISGRAAVDSANGNRVATDLANRSRAPKSVTAFSVPRQSASLVRPATAKTRASARRLQSSSISIWICPPHCSDILSRLGQRCLWLNWQIGADCFIWRYITNIVFPFIRRKIARQI